MHLECVKTACTLCWQTVQNIVMFVLNNPITVSSVPVVAVVVLFHTGMQLSGAVQAF